MNSTTEIAIAVGAGVIAVGGIIGAVMMSSSPSRTSYPSPASDYSGDASYYEGGRRKRTRRRKHRK